MKDPRLIEIELLARIEKETFLGKTNGWSPPSVRGGEVSQMLDALLNLMFDGAVIDGDYDRYGTSSITQPDAAYGLEKAAARSAAKLVAGGGSFLLRITHRGRLRLSRLRDEMLNKDRLREPFGVLWDKRHFLPDLEVRLRLHAFPEPFSLLLLDVDRLKALNAKLGHVGADDVLRGIFQTLQDLVKPHDAYRLGGDEAGAILPGVALAEATKLAEAVRAAVEREYRAVAVDDDGHTPTVSIGVGCAAAMLGAREFNERVDAIAERAKTTGKNKVEMGVVA